MPPSVAHALAPGHELDDYRIDTLLASGPFGLTYLAHDARIDTRVVIREYLPIAIAARGRGDVVEPLFPREGDLLRQAVAGFIERSRQLAAVRHVNVLRVARLFEANNTAYAVSEYEPGMTLLDWRARIGRPPQAALARVLGSALDGLAAMHGAGLVHLDLRPSKLRLRADGTALIVGSAGAAQHTPSGRDRDAMLQVTLGYSPLEIYYSTGKRGPWSDLYALAAIAYWLLTEEKPHEAPARLLDDALPKLAESDDLAGGYSRDFLAALDWALQLRPEDRPHDAAILRRALAAGGVEVTDAASVRSGMEAGALNPAVERASPSAWAPNAELLASAKAGLAHYLGPIAGVIAKKALTEATDWRDFCARAGSQIPDESARAQFLEAFSGRETPIAPPAAAPPKPAAAANQAAVAFTPELLAGLEAEVAGYLGAIARIVVRNAAGRARTRSELYENIAAELDDPLRARKFVAWAESRFGLR